MADQIYKVRDPQGNIREIKGPAGASDDDVIAQAQKLFSAAPSQPQAQTTEPSTRRKVAEFLAPTVEALGTAGGAALGTPAGPLGMLAGAGAGFAGAKELMRLAAGDAGGETLPESATRQAKNVLEGATMEALGRGVIAPAVSKGADYASKLKNIKLDQYIKAIGDKGDEIVNALRGRTQIVPGSAPTAGEAAAPAGSVGLSVLQARARQVPGAADTYASMESQNIAARQAQEARAVAKFDVSKQRLQDKINRGLVNVTPGEAGSALIDAAKAERLAVKKNIVEPAYKAAFDAAGNAKIDVSKVVSEAERILDRKLSEFATETAPDTVRKLRGFVPKTPEVEAVPIGKAGFKTAKPPTPPRATPEATLLQLDDVRKAINADIAAASTSNAPMAATTLKNLRQLHSAIDDAVKASETLPDEAKTLYQGALDSYRTQYAPRFKEGINVNLFKQTGLKETKIKPEDVVSKYFQPKGESEAKDFLRLFGKNPDALKIARTGIEDLYRREVADAAGRVTPESHSSFMKKYAEPLKILDNAGMNITQRVGVVAKDAARLAKIEELAKASGNKLAPPLPAGANALAVEKRIGELTKGFTPDQLSHVNAVRDDLIREGDYQRLVKSGADAGADIRSLASKTGREVGIPLPPFMSVPITIFNNVVKRLAMRMDDKLALEIARELTNPSIAADRIEAAIKLKAIREGVKLTRDNAAGTFSTGNPLSIGLTRATGAEMSRRAEPQQQQSQNALAR
jgi:protein required for attachment to host cells